MSEKIAAITFQYNPTRLEQSNAQQVLQETLSIVDSVQYLEEVFFYGYQAAISLAFGKYLDPLLGPFAVCVAEPSQQPTTAKLIDDQWVVNGLKTFVTAPAAVKTIIVSAITGETVKGKPITNLFSIPTNHANIVMQVTDQVSVLPRLGQGKVRLQNTALNQNQILPEQDYSNIKAFGVTESLTIAMAFTRFMANRLEQDKALQNDFLQLCQKYQQLSVLDLSAPSNILAIEPVAQRHQLLVKTAGLSQLYSPGVNEWSRDIGYFSMDSMLWQRRFAKAKAMLETK